MTTYKCTVNPAGDDHEFGDHDSAHPYKCAHCGDCEADWWYEHRDAIAEELGPTEPLVMKGPRKWK